MSLALPAAATGVACIFGGEALCLLGPAAYERQVHLVCHAILYAGAVLVVIGAALHWTSRRQRPPHSPVTSSGTDGHRRRPGH
jgi:hypothetical protein